MGGLQFISERNLSSEDLYHAAIEKYGAALDRLARGYEADTEKRRDLLQEIHLALWRSFGGFDCRCSMRTWIYRVAHNAATSYILRQRRTNRRKCVELEEVVDQPRLSLDNRLDLNRLLDLVRSLKPVDRQVILSYLEGMDAMAIGEITGLSPGYVATKIHRTKQILAQRFHEGGEHGR